MLDVGLLQFALARGVGEAALKKAIAFRVHSGITWMELAKDAALLRNLGIREAVIENIRGSGEAALRLRDELEQAGIQVLVEGDADYPAYLREILGGKCPEILFVKGNADLLRGTSVGFCGSRRASTRGLEIAASCAAQLVREKIATVSGYASGVDLAVHRATLTEKGKTIFVLAEGILKYRLKQEVCGLLDETNHVFVSQFSPYSVWNVGNAMRRNSLIIGLSRAMILVESGVTGGTFAAGGESLRVGCPLFVVDFAQPEVSAAANPYFISKGGIPIRSRAGLPNISRVLETARSMRAGVKRESNLFE